MLGDEVIVAPVLVQGQTARDIYLPKGEWLDVQSGIYYKGPKWLMAYDAPLEVLPYFVKNPVTNK